MEFFKTFFSTFILFALNPAIILMFIFILTIKIFGKRIIGWFGEYWTKEQLDRLPKDQYTVLNDILIETDGRTHQIDHIIISPYGIFSIETKQYNGFIIGNKYDKKWTRYVGKKKYYYENPIRQNYGHVKALSELLKIDEPKIYNIVCIPSKAKLKIEHDGELTRYDTLVDKILTYKEVVINNPNDIVDIINRKNITDSKIRKKHIKNIRNNIIDNDSTKCPKCGGQLVERNGQYGKFLGCSNYPKCKYTSNINR